MGVVKWLRGLADRYRERQAAQRRRRATGLQPGQRARDIVADDFLWVVDITDERAHDYHLNGTLLHQYRDNELLECADDRVVHCRYPGSEDSYAFPASRVEPIAFDTGHVVRDRFTGNTLKIHRFRTHLAADVAVDGTPLPRYGVNQTLDCETDWVADCTYQWSNAEYSFPLSRLVPRRSPTYAELWVDIVTSTRDCYSCPDGEKPRPGNAVCPDCRARILARDDATCQQKGCEATRDLQIHHLHYQPDPVGTIPDRYLITLCRDCHEERHGIH